MSTEPGSGAGDPWPHSDAETPQSNDAPDAPAPWMSLRTGSDADALSAFGRDSTAGQMWARARRALTRRVVALGIGALAIACLVVAASLLFGASRHIALPLPSPIQHGRVVVDSRPSGARVEIDGKECGVTPITLRLTAGRHVLAVVAGTRREIEVAVTPGAEIFHHIEMPDKPTASLHVETVPAGAPVSVDGRRRGTSPIEITGLLPGSHAVVVGTGAVAVRRTVQLHAGEANSVVLGPGAPGGPASGWLAITAPIDLEIYDDTRLVGKGRDARVLLLAGRHKVSLVNRDVGFEDHRTVDIAAGRTASLKVQPGNGILHINAIPWAEVWLDGRSIGQTPIANYSAAPGTHELVFRHPDLGEQRRTVVVVLTAPTRVGVSFRQ